MKSFIWYVGLIFHFSLTYFDLRRYRKIRNKISNEEGIDICQDIAKKFARKQVSRTGSEFIITGEENVPKDGAVLFMNNHQSNFDFGFYMGYIDKPKGYIAKAEMEKIPLLSSWMKELDCVFMDRSDMKKSAKSIIDGINILKSGYSLVICPEGTRSKGPQMGEFKGGSFKLATKSKVPIIPISIDGSYKIMEGNKGNKIKAEKVYVTIHPPVYTNDLTPEEAKELPKKVEDIIRSGLKQR